MKKIVALSARRNRRLCLAVLGLFTVAGIMLGSVLYVRHTVVFSSPWLNQCFAPSAAGHSALLLFCRLLASMGLFTVTAYLCGLFVFGQPLGAAMLIYRGIGIGASVAVLYSDSGTKALPAILVIVLPKAMLAVLVSVLAAREVMRSSNVLLRFYFGKENGDDKRFGFRLYTVRFAVLMLISAVSAAVGAAVDYFFSFLI